LVNLEVGEGRASGRSLPGIVQQLRLVSPQTFVTKFGREDFVEKEQMTLLREVRTVYECIGMKER
jgi:hypothetical protein